ncbi:hypothetical protein FRC03_003306 [Tulasnella sp. 419]|nr:hypothetical protein FRC02_001560 [Tulasnella sp. 418]KAG8942325.1 hypothetical protein FRC03_003306 [Tulasnella sp. 419]
MNTNESTTGHSTLKEKVVGTFHKITHPTSHGAATTHSQTPGMTFGGDYIHEATNKEEGLPKSSAYAHERVGIDSRVNHSPTGMGTGVGGIGGAVKSVEHKVEDTAYDATHPSNAVHTNARGAVAGESRAEELAARDRQSNEVQRSTGSMGLNNGTGGQCPDSEGHGRTDNVVPGGGRDHRASGTF